MTRRFPSLPAAGLARPSLLGARRSRRDFARLVGGLGAGAAALTLLRRGAGAQAASPAAPATPVVGPQANGTTLWRVQVGAMDMAADLDLQGFFPTTLTINAGDSVWFDFGPMPGVHVVNFLGGQPAPALFIPDSEAGTPVTGAPPKLIFNPAVVFPVGDNVYDGTASRSSGLAALRDPKQPYILTFPKAGSFDYLCLLHAAVMKATIVVQEAGSALPHQPAKYDAIAQDEIAKLQAEGKAEAAKYARAAPTKHADGTTLWEATVGAGPGQARVMAMLPKELTITAGDTVRWVRRSPGEPHTVTFANGVTPPEDIQIGQTKDGRPKLSPNPATMFPAGGKVYSGTGYFNSGYMGTEFNGPETYELTFDTPGEYVYYCALHGDAKGGGMAGKVIVATKA